MYCKKCGKEIKEGTRFCRGCGSEIKLPARNTPPAQSSEEPTVPQAAPQPVQTNAAPPPPPAPQPTVSAPAYQPAPPQQGAPQQGTVPPPKKKKKLGCLIAFLSVLLVVAILVTGLFTPGWIHILIKKLTPMPDYYVNGSDNSGIAVDNLGVSVGSTDTTGYALSAEPNTFANGSNVNMRVMSEEEAKQIETPGFTMLGSPVDLSCDGYNGEYLGKNVTLRFAIPDKYQTDNTRDMFVAYHDKETGEWQYYPYDYIDFEKNEMVFTVPHFSEYVPVEHRRAEAVDLYLDEYCANAAMAEKDAKKLNDLLAPDLKDYLSKMGVPSAEIADLANAITGKMLGNCASCSLTDAAGVGNNVVTALYKYSKDGEDGPFLSALTQTASEEVAKYLLEAKGYDTSIHPYPAKIAAGIIANSGDIVGSLETGDYKTVAEKIMSIGVSLEPTAAITMAAANLLRSGANQLYYNFQTNEIEKLYQMYKHGTGQFDEKNFQDLWESVDYWSFSGERAATRLYTVDHIKAYCQARGWSETDWKSLPGWKRDEINAQARKDLETYFQNRCEVEETAAKMKKQERKFLVGLYNVLDSSAYSDFFGDSAKYDPYLRLRKIYEVRAKIEALADTSKAHHDIKWYYYVMDWISGAMDGQDESTLYANAIKALAKEGILKDGIDVPDTTNPSIEEISGTWSGASITVSDVGSPLLEMLVGKLTEALDIDDIDILEKNEGTTPCTVTIEKLSKDTIRLTLDMGEGNYSVYEGKYSKGKASLKLKTDTSAGSEGVSVSIPKLNLTFNRNGKKINMSGTSKVNNFLAKADITISGTKLN